MTALGVTAEVANQLHVPAPRGFDTVLDQLRHDARLSAQHEKEARPVCSRRSTKRWTRRYHYDNVLWNGSQWKAIDPKPAAGPAEWDYLPLLRNRFTDYDPSDLPRSLRWRLDCLTDLTGGRRQQAYLFTHFRALLDANFAHRTRDKDFEHTSLALVAASVSP